MDGEFKADRALSESERLVNERYLGHCLHDDHSAWNDPNLGWCSRCRDCKRQIRLHCYVEARRPPAEVLSRAWNREHVKTAASPVNGAQLRYALERSGWCVRFFGKDGRTVCEVQKGSVILRSPSFCTQAEAVVEAGAMTLKNYVSGHCTHPEYLVQSTH